MKAGSGNWGTPCERMHLASARAAALSLAEVAGGDPLSDDQLRALWLRRVQTKPADFLRAKFAYQLQEREGGVK